MKKKSSKVRAKSKSPRGRTSQSDLSLRLGKEIWPLERDVLFRPDRMKYVRKLLPKEDCVFCRAAEMPVNFATLCVYKSEKAMVLLNKFPYNTGHLLVVPRCHEGNLTSLDQETFIELNETLRLAFKALQSVYNPSGINMGLNQGSVAGAGLPQHLHYHVIPRWAGDLNFFPLIAETKVVVETLETSYDRLFNFFREQGKG